MSPRILLPLALIAALATAGGALADIVRPVAADQAAARRIVLQAADLGAGWSGHSKKPDLSSNTLTCSSFHPKPPRIVATGAAETEWTKGPIDIDDQAEIVQKASMVAADWHSVIRPGVVACIREQFQKGLGSGSKLLSARQVRYPKLGTFTTDFRVTFSLSRNGTTARAFVDVLLVGKGRTELTLATTAPGGSEAAVQAAEVRLARLMVARTPAA